MRVMFDLWALYPDKIKTMTFEEQKVFETIFNFIYDRILILDNEITQEEAGTKDSDVFIMVEILNKKIVFHGYSESLKERLMGCFNENDEKILQERFAEAFAFLN